MSDRKIIVHEIDGGSFGAARKFNVTKKAHELQLVFVKGDEQFVMIVPDSGRTNFAMRLLELDPAFEVRVDFRARPHECVICKKGTHRKVGLVYMHAKCAPHPAKKS